MDSLIREISAANGWHVLELKVMPYHVHLFVQCNPTGAPTKIIKTLKGISGLHLFRNFPDLHKKLWKGMLWSPSYYVGTAGHVSAQTIEWYIREQKSRRFIPRTSLGVFLP